MESEAQAIREDGYLCKRYRLQLLQTQTQEIWNVPVLGMGRTVRKELQRHSSVCEELLERLRPEGV